jgi:hypothetical protein
MMTDEKRKNTPHDTGCLTSIAICIGVIITMVALCVGFGLLMQGKISSGMLEGLLISITCSINFGGLILKSVLGTNDKEARASVDENEHLLDDFLARRAADRPAFSREDISKTKHV